jgi:hypothetical protein
MVEVEWAPPRNMAHGRTKPRRSGDEYLAWVGSESSCRPATFEACLG